jgi:hypothetical protein
MSTEEGAMAMWEGVKKWVRERARGLLWLCVGILFSGAAIAPASYVIWFHPTETAETTETNNANMLKFDVLRFLPPKSDEKIQPDQSCLDCEVKDVELHYMMPEEGKVAQVKFTFVQKTPTQKGKFKGEEMCQNEPKTVRHETK